MIGYVALVYKSPRFRPKNNVFYVFEVADSESNLSLHGKALVSEILAFNHLLKYPRGQLGHRGHVHLGQNFFFMILRVIRVYEGFWGFCTEKLHNFKKF